MIEIKICGITRLEDAIAAVESGATMLGYNFYPLSPRYLSQQGCRAIQDGLKDRGYGVRTVGVFVNTPTREIQETLNACELDLAQLSGDEPVSQLLALGEKAFKGLRPRSRAEMVEQVAALPPLRNGPDCLVDAFRAGVYGGTGETGDWELACTLAREKRILLAGGLDPGNVAQAISSVRPWGVDVASGVEKQPGIKDPLKIREFIQAATREFQSENGC